jgi:SAM-dependent methyltransferase
MNPLSLEKLLLVADICHVGQGTRLLDLACGKGEMLCRFASDLGASGVGIDNHAPFLADARARAAELGAESAVTFIEGDAGAPPDLGGRFEAVSCIGATWIGGGLLGTLELMGRWVEPGGWLLVGEVYWSEPPPPQIEQKYGAGEFADLAGTLDRFDAAGMDLVEIILASSDDWDRYAASQWLNVSDWLVANPDDADAAEVRQLRDTSRRDYLAHERRCLGWGVFVLRARV